MIACLRFHLLQVWRSRLLVLWLFFSFFAQYGTAKILFAAKIQYQQVQVVMGLPEVVTALVIANFFSGMILASVFGIWTVPYLHEDSRSQLTFSLPVSKWVFPGVYSISFALLFLCQVAALLLSLALQFGFSAWVDPTFPWKAFVSASVVSLVALEVVVFFLAVTSMAFGKATAFIGGTTLLTVLQLSGAFFQAGMGREGNWYLVYSFLPPLGEVLFDIKIGSLFATPVGYHLLLWVFWGLILASLIKLKLNRA